MENIYDDLIALGLIGIIIITTSMILGFFIMIAPLGIWHNLRILNENKKAQINSLKESNIIEDKKIDILISINNNIDDIVKKEIPFE